MTKKKLPPLDPRPCLTCGESFQPVRRNNVYCSTPCAMAPVRVKEREKLRAEAAARGPRPVRLCSREGCEGKHLARGLCGRHYRALRRSEGHNDGYLRNGDDRERAAHWGVPWELIDRAAVFARDGWKCHLCGELVDRLALFPAPESPSLDHVVPMSRGGGHLWGNVATAHLGCNVRKGAGAARPSPP